MSTITADVRHLEVKERTLVAKFETINGNEDEFEIELLNPFVEGLIVDEKVIVSAIVDVFGYNLVDRSQEILIESEVDVQIRPETFADDTFESVEFLYEVAEHGSLSTDPLPELTRRETMLSLGDKLKIRLTFSYK